MIRRFVFLMHLSRLSLGVVTAGEGRFFCSYFGGFLSLLGHSPLEVEILRIFPR